MTAAGPHSYWIEFSEVALAHFLAVVSPGPDFALVLRQSIAHGRKTATWTAVGVGTGILFHVGYSLLGIGLLIKASTLWFNVVKYAGAAYLAWIGVQALRSKPRGDVTGAMGAADRVPAHRGAFVTGFITNALNPKATLFFISLFAMLVSPQTPKLVQTGYGLWMACATAGWFIFVGFVFTREVVQRNFLRMGHWIDRALGVLFLSFAAALLFATVTRLP